MNVNNNENDNIGYNNHTKIGEKINQLLSNDEGKLIRTILIASFIIIVICLILYFNYILLGEFFTTIFLAFICSLSLKPSKDKLIYKLKRHLRQSNKYFVTRSWIFVVLRVLQILRLLSFITSYVQKPKMEKLRLNSEYFTTEPTVESETSEEEKAKYTIYNNINYLIFICIVYIMIFKLKIFISVTIISIYFFADFSTRLTMDIFIILSRKNNRLNLTVNNTTREFVHSIISSLMIMIFILFVVFVITLGIGLFYLDIKKMYNYLNENNDLIKVIKNNLLESDKIKNYQQTIFEQFKSIEEYLNNTYIKIDSHYTQSSFIQDGNYTLFGKL